MPSRTHASIYHATREPAGKTRQHAEARSKVPHHDPWKRFITSSINCAEINRACDAFFVRTIPGYRVMNIGGITPKRTA